MGCPDGRSPVSLRRPAQRVLRAGRREQAREGGATGLPQEFVYRGGECDLPALKEALQEFRHEGVEAMGADAPGRLPQDLGRAAHLRPIARRPAGARGTPRRPGGAPQESDGGLAMNLGDGHDLVQQPALLRSTEGAIPLPLPGRVLPKTRSRHGVLLRRIGNRDF